MPASHVESLVSSVNLYLVIDHRIRLELDQPVRIDESRHLHDRIGRSNCPEVLAVDRRHGFPVFDSGQQRAGPYHLIE